MCDIIMFGVHATTPIGHLARALCPCATEDDCGPFLLLRAAARRRPSDPDWRQRRRRRSKSWSFRRKSDELDSDSDEGEPPLEDAGGFEEWDSRKVTSSVPTLQALAA